jgi:hypothetical protein
VAASDAVSLRPRSGYANHLQGNGERSAMTMSAQTRPVVHPDIKPENPPERSSHYVDADPAFMTPGTTLKRHPPALPLAVIAGR